MSNTNILKQNWERGHDFIDLSQADIQNIITPFTNQEINSIKLCATGCANTNYILEFTDKSKLMLRIYTRDSSAISREQFIYKLISDANIPMPKIIYTDVSKSKLEHPFALVEFKEGENMRDVILRGDDTDIKSCALAAGKLCAKLANIKLPKIGFFEDNGSIRELKDEEKFENFALTMLNKNQLINALDAELIKKIKNWIKQYKDLVSDLGSANLTHADFDPANMLVIKNNGRYQITALLDWEFCFAGSYLMDVGQFLRYGHKIPNYSSYFIKGFELSNLQLPENWELKAKILDILCLLNLLYHNPVDTRPNLNKDVIGLITHTIDNYKLS